jgi:hypothetical protein
MRALFVMGTLAAAVLMLFAAAPPADADFHLMQIEQIIGGVNGDTTAQAIQLRMRADGQGGLTKGRLVAYDATGKNAVVLIDFPMDIFPEVQGERILIASRPFSSHTNPAAAPDFVLANMIPPSYLAAGSLTFEHEGQLGVVLWRISWGGAAYTGPNRGTRFNDDDGNFGPPVSGALPSASTSALLFDGAAADKSTSNAQDYVVTGGPGSAGPTVFTNSKGETFVVTQ